MSTLAEKVAEQLRLAIMAGELPPGSSLREEQLASSLHVSRIPVREALRTLKGQGLLLHRSHAGMIVRPNSIDDAIEIYEIRNLIEPSAIQWSIEKMSEKHALVLLDLAEQMSCTLENGEWMRLRDQFIFDLYEPMNRPLVRSIIQQLNTLSGQYLFAGNGSNGNRSAATAFAKRLAQFCMDADGPGAARLFRDTTRSVLLAYQINLGMLTPSAAPVRVSSAHI